MARRIRLITVCDACLRASCWHGEFMCSDAQSAGTVQKTAAELRKLGREHRDHYSRANVESVCGSSDYVSVTPSLTTGGTAPTPSLLSGGR